MNRYTEPHTAREIEQAEPTSVQKAHTTAPERIWAKVHGASTDVISGQRGLLGGWNERPRDGQIEYLRADWVAEVIENLSGQIEQAEARERALLDSNEEARQFLRLRDQMQAEIDRLTAELEKANRPEWFYSADGYESEACRDSIHEVLEEDYFWDRAKTGQHAVQINVARALPSIWVAVRFPCECGEGDYCECESDPIITEHASEAEARAALKGGE